MLTEPEFARWQQLSQKMSPTRIEIMDTPEKAEAEGVPLGTSVLRREMSPLFSWTIHDLWEMEALRSRM